MRNTGIRYNSKERMPTVLSEMAELLPPLSGEQLAVLEADLLANGCYAPVIVNEDKVTILRSEKTYVDLFTGRVTRGPKKGMVRSFPVCGKCYVQRDYKLRPIERYRKTLPPDTVQYIGIAKDEQARLLRLGGGQKISLLEKYDFTEQDAKELCQTAGLLSPVYEFTDRGGCWFCPNAKRKELRHLYDHHPELWNRMLELQAIPGKVSEKFDRKRRFSDIDALFRQEDACNEAAGKAA